MQIYGKVIASIGTSYAVGGLIAGTGKLCAVRPPYFKEEGYLAEVTAFDGKKVMVSLLDRGSAQPGWWVTPEEEGGMPVGDALLGRVLDGAGRPVDGRFLEGCGRASLDDAYLSPMERPLVHEALPTGVRAVDALLTCGRGQRVGIFAGSGVGKSTLLGMIVRNAKADACVVTLVGERGREMREFVYKTLGEGRDRAVIIAAAADTPPLMRVRAVKTSAAIAGHFRSQGKHVVWIIDSATRLAHALREIGLSAGEPPATRGYPPSTFTKMAELMEFAGPSPQGTVTLFCTVLVEGDDHSEPVSDALKSILDGHIVLSRELAGRGHYPAVDVLASVSRLMPDVVDAEHMKAARAARDILAAYAKVDDLISINAYVPGSNPRYDTAREKIGALVEFLKQDVNEKAEFKETIKRLKELVG